MKRPARTKSYTASFGNLIALQLSTALPDAAIEPQEATQVVALPNLGGIGVALDVLRLSTRLLSEGSGGRRRP